MVDDTIQELLDTGQSKVPDEAPKGSDTQQGIVLDLHRQSYVLPWAVSSRWESVEPWILKIHSRETQRLNQHTQSDTDNRVAHQLDRCDLILDSSDQKDCDLIIMPELWRETVLPGSHITVKFWQVPETSPSWNTIQSSVTPEDLLSNRDPSVADHDKAACLSLPANADATHSISKTEDWHHYQEPLDHKGKPLCFHPRHRFLSPVARRMEAHTPLTERGWDLKGPTESRAIAIQGSYFNSSAFKITLFETPDASKNLIQPIDDTTCETLVSKTAEDKSPWHWLHVDKEFPDIAEFRKLATLAPGVDDTLLRTIDGLMALVCKRMDDNALQDSFVESGTVLRVDNSSYTEKKLKQCHATFVCVPLLCNQSQIDDRGSKRNFSIRRFFRSLEPTPRRPNDKEPSSWGSRITTRQLWALTIGEVALLTCGNVRRED
ncbi:hypothetical protein IWZ01DRAFT_550240, partial [Phyllosticta capitalensis]